MVVICALITCFEGKGGEYLENFKGLAPKVRKDPGAITYVIHRKTDDPDQFFVFEQYEDEDAVKYHSSTEHFKAYRQKIAALVKERQIGFYHEVV
ncbi:MAG: antibiotic biosynthesis monooxygenase [Spirochaetales bacterium]|nr:antibiotic biosynthesis monooxygenase [Spirochaetales bacterium]